MTFSLARESFTPALLAELKPLILANHAATGSDAPLEPSWELFEKYDKGDAMALIVCRFNERAVGYCATVVHHHQLYGERWAICLAIYLEPKHRRRFMDLVDMVEWMATEAGAACVSYNLPWAMNCGAFRHLGYAPSEVVMTKRLT